MNNESTIIFCMFCQCYCWTLHPERGRKLNFLVMYIFLNLLNCWTLHPERGRKLDAVCDVAERVVGLLDSSPREGTETVHRSIHNRFPRHIVGLFTPRGDGNSSTVSPFASLRVMYCWTLHPERGRKLSMFSIFFPLVNIFIVGLFTPRGDGNRVTTCV